MSHASLCLPPLFWRSVPTITPAFLAQTLVKCLEPRMPFLFFFGWVWLFRIFHAALSCALLRPLLRLRSCFFPTLGAGRDWNEWKMRSRSTLYFFVQAQQPSQARWLGPIRSHIRLTQPCFLSSLEIHHHPSPPSSTTSTTLSTQPLIHSLFFIRKPDSASSPLSARL